MAELANERVAYYNGEIRLERDVLIPFRDHGFKFGDAAFDTLRSFGHRIFKLEAHVNRLYRSLRYLQIDPGLAPEEMMRITEEVFAKNRHLLAPDDDYWITERVSRGVVTPEGDAVVQEGATVIVECMPIPFKSRARLYRDGIDLVVPPVRRTPPESLSPRAKTQNYLNLILGDLGAKARDPEAWSLMLDHAGNVAEGMASNFFMVTDGRLLTPDERFVLGGISRETVIELAREIGVALEETDIDLFDVYNADEAFLTSTSLALCPVRSVDGRVIGAGTIPGPVTQRLLDAYGALVGLDIAGQYLKRL
jgi:branched-chain amino acid aminotransferase